MSVQNFMAIYTISVWTEVTLLPLEPHHQLKSSTAYSAANLYITRCINKVPVCGFELVTERKKYIKKYFVVFF